jgi:hypothetical protein
MDIETPLATSQSSEASVGSLFDSAIKETNNPTPVETPQQIETPAAIDPATPEVKPETVTQTQKETPKKPEEISKWKELKGKADELEKVLPRITEYEKKAMEAEKKAAEIEARYRTIEEEKKGYESELTENRTWRMAFDLENTPEYQNNVTRPFVEAQQSIERLASQFEIDPQEMWKVATEGDEVARAKGCLLYTSPSPRD